MLTAFCTEPTFEFRADGASTQDVARAIGEHFKVSLFVEPKVAERKVTGYLREGSLETALNTLSFFTQSTWRRAGEAIYIGDEEKERYFAVPSAGLDAAAIKVIWPNSVLSGDTILVKAKPTDFAQLKDVVESMQRRQQFTTRILICDVGANYRDPVNTFLGSLKLGITATGDLAHGARLTAPITIQDVYEFLKSRTDVRIKTFTDYRIVSGEETKLTAGNVLERQVFIRPTEALEGNANTLVTRFDRLQLGLTVVLRAFKYADRWFVRFQIEDADFENERERRTSSQGAVEIHDHRPVKVVSLDRMRTTSAENEVRGLGRLPLLGRAFRSKGGDSENRVLFVFVQWLPDEGAEMESSLPAVGLSEQPTPYGGS